MFSELGARKIAARWVPHELTAGQKELRLVICTEHMQSHNSDKRWGIVISIDETYLKATFEGQELIAHQYYANAKSITNVEYLDFLSRVAFCD